MKPTYGCNSVGLSVLPSGNTTSGPVGTVTTKPPASTLPVWRSLTKAYLVTIEMSPKSLPLKASPPEGSV